VRNSGSGSFNNPGNPKRERPPEDDESLPDAESLTRRKDTDSDMSKTPAFYGKAGQLEPVLTWVHVKSLADGITSDSQRAGLVAAQFRGPALNWLTAELKTNRDLLANYVEFEATLIKTFGLTEAAKQAISARQLSSLRQNKSVQDYAVRFRQLAADSGLEGSAAIAYFVKGLKFNVRSALIINEAQTSIDNAIDEAIRIDSQLYYAGSNRGGTPHARGSGRDQKGRFQKSRPIKKEYDY